PASPTPRPPLPSFRGLPTTRHRYQSESALPPDKKTEKGCKKVFGKPDFTAEAGPPRIGVRTGGTRPSPGSGLEQGLGTSCCARRKRAVPPGLTAGPPLAPGQRERDAGPPVLDRRVPPAPPQPGPPPGRRCRPGCASSPDWQD